LHKRHYDSGARGRSRKSSAGAVTLLLAAASLSGCAEAPSATPTPALSATINQDQRDDQAFEVLFTKYVSIDLGNEAADELTPLLTGSALQGELESIEYSTDHHQTVIGKAVARGFRVTDRGTDDQGTQYMTAQACLDISGTRTLDADGNDVTPSRTAAVALQLKAVRIADGTWRISDSLRNEETHACE
jgi:hypothetical protein